MESQSTKAQLYYHTIDSTNASDDAINHLFTLSKDVFSDFYNEDEAPNPTDEQQQSEDSGSNLLSGWLESMKNPSAVIYYASREPTPDPSAALGVFFSVPRTHPEIGHELYHLRVAAFRAAARGLGIFPMLMERTEQHARALGYKEMTVCTYPDTFENMFRILKKNGWEVVAWRQNGIKVLMKQSL